MSVPVVLDDAAIFPPGDLPLEQAVAAHRRHRRAPYAALVGPLVVASADLDALAGLVGDEPLEVAVVVPDRPGAPVALERARSIAGLRPVALEVRATEPAGLHAALGAPEGVTVYVELPRGERCARVVAELAGSPYRAKVRTGGVTAAMHPDEAELAATVVALAAAGVPFKATAGLHHALRTTDPETGFEQHGIVNLLLATDAARRGATVAEVAAVLAERDVRGLPAASTGSALPTLPARTLLCSIGTCSITGPVDELTALGLLDVPGVPRVPGREPVTP